MRLKFIFSQFAKQKQIFVDRQAELSLLSLFLSAEWAEQVTAWVLFSVAEKVAVQVLVSLQCESTDNFVVIL